uniref:hypothetical protein n=1 Tax=Paractinoplanes polyasparticus TaxID=2856853 RepID=UPI001C857733|nr:hypothetical protein [Actinoplanes polyasparticus]
MALPPRLLGPGVAAARRKLTPQPSAHHPAVALLTGGRPPPRRCRPTDSLPPIDSLLAAAPPSPCRPPASLLGAHPLPAADPLLPAVASLRRRAPVVLSASDSMHRRQPIDHP